MMIIPFTKRGFGLFVFRILLLSMIVLFTYMMIMTPIPEKILAILPGLLLVILILVGIVESGGWRPKYSRKELFGFNFGARWKKD